MPHRQFIRSFGVALLLLTFAFGMTPRMVWHELLADHTYASHERSTDHDLQLNLDCHADHLVVLSPFISELPVFNYTTRQQFTLIISEPEKQAPITCLTLSTLRGPPAVA